MTDASQSLSFEVFPPKTEKGHHTLMKEMETLAAFSPEYISVTYGAGGSTRDRTLDIALEIRDRFDITPLVHFTCVGFSADEVEEYIRTIRKKGISDILALRGDPPAGEENFRPHPEGFGHADELVRFIKSREDFHVAVAGYPEGHIEAPDLDTDITYLKQKVDAGGELIITQLFFDNRDFFTFIDKIRSRGIEVPVTAGIMPVTGIQQIERSIELSGAKIPPALQQLLDRYDSDEDLRKAGLEYSTRQCEELRESGATEGFHFYTLNRAASTSAILEGLGWNK